MMTRYQRAATLALTLAVATPAAAQNETVIDGGRTSGVTTVNGASGNNNQQVNAGTVSIGASALSTATVHQALETTATSGADSTMIAPGAFAGSSGWIAASGVSGNDNQQANIASFGFGTGATGAADAVLSQTRASTRPAGELPTIGTQADRSVEVGRGAFANASGVVQVSLIGGDRNMSANAFALSVSGPADH